MIYIISFIFVLSFSCEKKDYSNWDKNRVVKEVFGNKECGKEKDCD